MRHPFVRFVLGTFAVLIVVAILKMVGMSPNHIFKPHDNWGIDFGFGRYNLGNDDQSWFNPLLLVHVLAVPAVWHLCRRAGYSSWFSLAMLVPLANVTLLYFLAFAEWPAQPRDDRPGAAADPRKPPPPDRPTPRSPSEDIRI